MSLADRLYPDNKDCASSSEVSLSADDIVYLLVALWAETLLSWLTPTSKECYYRHPSCILARYKYLKTGGQL